MKKRNEKETQCWKQAAWDLLYLTRCGINAHVPEEERVAKMDLNKVYVLSRRQSLESITYLALERLAKTGKKVWRPDSEPVC